MPMRIRKSGDVIETADFNAEGGRVGPKAMPWGPSSNRTCGFPASGSPGRFACQLSRSCARYIGAGSDATQLVVEPEAGQHLGSRFAFR